MCLRVKADINAVCACGASGYVELALTLGPLCGDLTLSSFVRTSLAPAGLPPMVGKERWH